MTESTVDDTAVAAPDSNKFRSSEALVSEASQTESAAYSVPEIFYRETSCLLQSDSGLNSPMSNDAARTDCRKNAAIEKALLGGIPSQVCKCAISFSEGSRLADEGAIRSRRCGRDQSAFARHIGRMTNDYISPRPDLFIRLVILSSASSKVGELGTSNLLRVGRAELIAALREAGVTSAVGWSTIVTDGRTHNLRAADSALYPIYRVWSQVLVSKQAMPSAEPVLKEIYGLDLLMKSMLPGSADFKPMDASCAPGYSYGVLEDSICHIPVTLFGLSPRDFESVSEVALKDLEAKPLLGLQKVEVAAALGLIGPINHLLLLGLRMVRFDGGYRFVDVDHALSVA